MPSDHLILCSHLLLLLSIFPSIRVFTNESALPIRWSKYWCFSVSPSNEYSELISFRIDWFDLLAVWVCHNFPSKEQGSFNFTVAVTIHSDFRDQENKICHCFHFFPFYLFFFNARMKEVKLTIFGGNDETQT